MNIPPVNTTAVVPVLIGPIQVLLTLLPAILVAIGATLVSLFKPRVLKQIFLLAWRLKIPLAIIVAAVMGIGWAASALWPAGSPAAEAEEAGRDWPVFRGNLLRTGVVGDGPGPTTGEINWEFHGDDEAFFASPAVVGNRVYISSAKLGMTARGGSGRIYALDADTGAVVWESRPSGYSPAFSSPVVTDDYLLVGEGLHYHINSRLICLDRRTGEVVWEYRTKCHVECTPVVMDDKVFVGAGCDGIYAFALEGDGEGGPKLLWHGPGEEYIDAETSLIAYDGRVYLGLGNDGEALAVLDAETGEEIERLDFPYPLFSPPAIDDGKLYVGMGVGDYVATAESLGQRPVGQMVRVDLETLEVDWEYKVGDTILGSPALTDDALYFGSRDGHIYCLGHDGELLWKWNTQAPILTSPAVTDTHVYVVAENGTLYILDRADGRPVTQVTLGTQPLFISSPAVARGQVYVGTQHDGLLSIGQPGDEHDVPLWSGPLGGAGKAGNIDGSPLPDVGDFLWNFPPEQMGGDDGTRVSATPAAIQGRLLLPLAGGTDGLAALPLDGAPDEAPEPEWVYETPNGLHVSPAARGDEALLVDGREGDDDRRLHCLDSEGGRLLWDLPVAADATGLFSLTRDQVLIQDAVDELAMVDAEGEVLWRQETGTLAAAPTSHRAMVILADTDGHMSVLDRSTGKRLWRSRLAGTPVGQILADRDKVHVPTSEGLEALSLADGRALDGWRLAGGPASADFAATANELLYVNEDGQLIVLDRDDGSVLHRIDGAKQATTPLVTRGTVLYHGPEQLMAWGLGDEGEPTEWMDVSWLGEPSAAMVLYGSRVYLPRTGWGVVVTGAAR